MVEMILYFIDLRYIFNIMHMLRDIISLLSGSHPVAPKSEPSLRVRHHHEAGGGRPYCLPQLTLVLLPLVLLVERLNFLLLLSFLFLPGVLCLHQVGTYWQRFASYKERFGRHY